MDGETYLARVAEAGSYGERQAVLEEAQALENEDRKVFALEDKTAPEAVELASKPYKGLVAIFEDEGKGGASRFTQRKLFRHEDAAIPRLFQWSEEERATRWSAPATVPRLKDFEQQFMQIFACNGLQFLNWDNIVAAGGAISACVQPIPKEHSDSLLQKRAYYHEVAYSASDIDLFLYDLSPEEANKKVLEIYDALCAACPFEVICFRSANAISMVSQYPYRHVQVVLRIYSSPYEVLAGFDVDCCTFLYDGAQVYTTPRGHAALMLGANTIDMSRRSPSYEMRLAKYGVRGFEVLLPDFDRDLIDPNIFDKPWNLLVGLQRLIVLDRLRSAEARLRYQTRHQVQSGMALRLNLMHRNYDQLERIEKAGSASESSNYATVFLPWGPRYDARKVLKLMKRKDIALNSPYYRQDRAYYLHPCFFGTAAEILKDCSPNDPELPDDVPASELRSYVRGPLTWMQVDPGQQQVGSFNPITETDWSRGAYFETTTSDVVAAVNRDDVVALSEILEDLGDSWDAHRRDYLGRSPLHVGIMAGADQACAMLLDADVVDPTLRLPDGRSTLHLAAEYNRVHVLRALLPAIRRIETARADYDAKPQAEKDDLAAAGVVPPRQVTVVDTLVVKTFKTKLMPLEIAIIMGHVDVVRVLVEDYGARANSFVCPPNDSTLYTESLRDFLKLVWNEEAAVPIILMVPPGETLEPIVELLLDHGAAQRSALVSSNFMSVFHLAAFFGHIQLIEALIAGLDKRDPGLLESMLDMLNFNLRTPLMIAVGEGHIECAKALYARSPSFEVSDERLAEARIISSKIELSSSRYFRSTAPLNSPSVTSVDNCLAIACASLLSATNDLIDLRGKAAILQKDRFGFFGYYTHNSGVEYEDYVNGRDGIFARSLDDDGRAGEDDDDDDDLDGQVGLNKDLVATARKRLDSSAAVLHWVLSEGAADKLWDKEYEFTTRIFLGFELAKPKDPYYVDDSDGKEKGPERGTILDILKLVRTKIMAKVEALHESANAAAFEKALAKVHAKYADPSTFEGYLILQEVEAHPVSKRMGNPSRPSMPDDKRLAKAQSFVARLDLLMATIAAAARGDDPDAAGSKPVSSRRSMRGFLRGLGSSKRSSVPRLVAGLTSLGASAEGAATAARTAAAAADPAPSTAPKKAISVEEYIAKIEAKLFRTYTLDVPQKGYYWGQHARDRSPRQENPAVPSSHVDFVFATFKAVFLNDEAAVLAALARTDLPFPLILVRDAKMNSLLGTACAFMHRPLAVVTEILAVLDKSWTSSKAPADDGEQPKRRKGARRIDNMKLAAKEDDDDDNEDEDDEDEDEDEDELLLDDDLDRDDGRTEAVTKGKEVNRVLDQNPMAIFLHKSAVIMCTVCLPHDMVLDMLPAHVLEPMLEAEGARRRGKAIVALDSFVMDLLRISILRKNFDVLELLLQYARGITTAPDPYSPPVLNKVAFEWCTKTNIACYAVALDSVEALRIIARVAGGGVPNYLSLATSVGLPKTFKSKNSNLERYAGMTTVIEQSKDGERRKRVPYDSRISLVPTWDCLAATYGSREVYMWLRDHFDELVTDFEVFLSSDSSNSVRLIRTFAEEALDKLYTGKFWHLYAEPRLADRVDSPAQMLAALVGRTCLDIPVQCGPTGASVIHYALEMGRIDFIETIIENDLAMLDEPCAITTARKKPKYPPSAEGDEGPEYVRGPGGSEVCYTYPLLVAAATGSVSVFRRLLELGVNPHVKFPVSGSNALQTFASRNNDGKLDVRRFSAAIEAMAEVCGQEEVLRALAQRNKSGVTCFQLLFAETNAKVLEHLFDVVASKDWIDAHMIQKEVENGVWTTESRDKVALLIKFVETGELFRESDDGKTTMDVFLGQQIDLAAALVRGNPRRPLVKAPDVSNSRSLTRYNVANSYYYGGYRYGGKAGFIGVYALLPDLSSHPLLPSCKEMLRKHRPRDLVDFPTAQAAAFKKLEKFAAPYAQRAAAAAASFDDDDEEGLWQGEAMFEVNALADSGKPLHALLGQDHQQPNVTFDDSPVMNYY